MSVSFRSTTTNGSSMTALDVVPPLKRLVDASVASKVIAEAR